MSNYEYEKIMFLTRAVDYVKKNCGDIVVLLVVKTKSSNDFQNQYDVSTEFFSTEELADYIEALNVLGIYHDISYGEDEFIDKIKNEYFRQFHQKHKIVFNTTGSKRIRSRSALIPAICELVGLSYASSDITTCSVLENKIYANSLLEHFGFPIPKTWYYSPTYGWLNNRPPQDKKLIVKPSAESASIGITNKSVGYYSNEFEKLIEEVSNTLHEPVIIQDFIEGWEVEVPVLNIANKVMALPPMGIALNDVACLNDNILGFEAVFSDEYDYYRYDCVDKNISQSLQNIAEKSVHMLDLRGNVRVDFRINKEGQSFITDYNNSPHLTRFHSVAKSLMTMGFEYPDLFCLILYNSISSQKSLQICRSENR